MASETSFVVIWGGFGGSFRLSKQQLGAKYAQQVAFKTDWKWHLKIKLFGGGPRLREHGSVPLKSTVQGPLSNQQTVCQTSVNQT